MLSINPKKVTTEILQHYLQSSIAPRPIALASTVDKKGNVNLSPFSFFNIFSTNPPILIFSPNRRMRDGSTKHTLENVLEHDEVVINMVDYEMVEQMSLSSCEYDKGINEFEKSGFTSVKSEMVKPPRVGESKASFECKVKQVMPLGEQGGAGNLILCEVVLAHFSEAILDENNQIDQTKTDWIARLGANYYCRASGEALFEVEKPNRNKGVGVDAIPNFIKTNEYFTSNDFGRLGNIEVLPTTEEIMDFRQRNPMMNYINAAKTFIDQHNIKEAWLALMQLEM